MLRKLHFNQQGAVIPSGYSQSWVEKKNLKIKKKTQLEYLVNEKQVQRGFIPFDQISGLSPREPRVMNRLRGF